MRTPHSAALVAAAAAMASVAALGSGPAAADAPAPTWDPARNRTLTCGTETVTGQWAPGGVYTACLIKDSTDVIVAKRAIVKFPGGAVYEPRLAPGFDVSKADTYCTYTDPAGLYIKLWGLRS